MQIPGWFLLLYLIYAQAIPAFSYDMGVALGTHESADQITEVGVAFWYGFAFGDFVSYIPLLAEIGLLGHWIGKTWGRRHSFWDYQVQTNMKMQMLNLKKAA